MRTWIIIGCLCICHAIAPEQLVPTPVGVILGVVIMVGMVMDVTEFIFRKGY